MATVPRVTSAVLAGEVLSRSLERCVRVRLVPLIPAVAVRSIRPITIPPAIPTVVGSFVPASPVVVIEAVVGVVIQAASAIRILPCVLGSGSPRRPLVRSPIGLRLVLLIPPVRPCTSGGAVLASCHSGTLRAPSSPPPTPQRLSCPPALVLRVRLTQAVAVAGAVLRTVRAVTVVADDEVRARIPEVVSRGTLPSLAGIGATHTDAPTDTAACPIRPLALSPPVRTPRPRGARASLPLPSAASAILE